MNFEISEVYDIAGFVVTPIYWKQILEIDDENEGIIEVYDIDKVEIGDIFIIKILVQIPVS